MAIQQYRLVGVVINRATRRGVPSVRVEAWDRDTRYHDMLGVAITNVEGGFAIGFDTNYFGDYAPDRAPDVFFKVFLDERLIKSTFDTAQYNLAAGDTQVTLEIDLGSATLEGRDRVSGEQMIKILRFVQDSDFRGVWQEQRDKMTTVGKFIGAAGNGALKNFDLKPVRPSATPTKSIVGQDTQTAQRNLAAKQIAVVDVKAYDPKLDTNSLQAITAFPLRLKPDDKVVLYEKDGKVQYYSVVKPVAAASVDTAAVARIDNEVQTLKATAIDVAAVRADVESVKVTTAQSNAQLTADLSSVKAQVEDVARLKSELRQVQQVAAAKDVQIEKLLTEVASLRNAQQDLTTRISPERINQLEEQIKRLSVRKVAPPKR